jgi:glutamate--cysteine ligase
MSTLFGRDDAAPPAPLKGVEELTAIFSAGEKPRDRFGIGIEYERLPLHAGTGRAVPYGATDGRGRSPLPSVESFLEGMEARGWTAEREQGRIIALQRDATRVTLEPGAQVELSGGVHTDLARAGRELDAFQAEAEAVAGPMGLVFLGLGLQPFTPVEEIGWVPKRRYGIMGPWLARRGHLAHHMMKATAGCQINLDFSSEDEAMEMLRTAMGVSTLVTALCANSPLSVGQANGFLTKRSHIWMHTDPDRCGLLPFALEPGARYRDYAAWALDVPMLFVVREHGWVDMTGRTFRQFLANGQGLAPTFADWQLHLTTLFPEVRLKSYLEVRGSDSGPPAMVMAQAALWKGLLYDPAARRRAWGLVSGASFAERTAFWRDVTRQGLRARLRGVAARDLAGELVALAAGALPPHEADLLAPMQEVVRTGTTPAERVRALWTGPCERQPARLVDALAREAAAGTR